MTEEKEEKEQQHLLVGVRGGGCGQKVTEEKEEKEQQHLLVGKGVEN